MFPTRQHIINSNRYHIQTTQTFQTKDHIVFCNLFVLSLHDTIGKSMLRKNTSSLSITTLILLFCALVATLLFLLYSFDRSEQEKDTWKRIDDPNGRYTLFLPPNATRYGIENRPGYRYNATEDGAIYSFIYEDWRELDLTNYHALGEPNELDLVTLLGDVADKKIELMELTSSSFATSSRSGFPAIDIVGYMNYENEERLVHGLIIADGAEFFNLWSLSPNKTDDYHQNILRDFILQ